MKIFTLEKGIDRCPVALKARSAPPTLSATQEDTMQPSPRKLRASVAVVILGGLALAVLEMAFGFR
jgi:hypothetical protein